MNEAESKAQPLSKQQKIAMREKALKALNSFDKEIPPNPDGALSFEEITDSPESFESLLPARQIKAGQVVPGKIIKVTNDHVIVDINYKSEGFVPRSEFRKPEDGGEELAPGQTVEVYIEQIENKNGIVSLSKDKANIKKVWQDIIQAKEQDSAIQGRVTSTVKGGLSVDIGIKAFLPGSQIDVRPVRKPESFVGQTLDFKILKINHKRGNVILSRKPLLEKEREKFHKIEDIKPGAVVKGVVKNITDYGAFVDLGDKDGLLHITDMSWSRVEHPSKLLRIGQELELKILKTDPEKNRISLGLKQLNEEKWEEAISRYKVGSVVKGVVSSVVDYGAFILLDGGMEGLVHINEMSWTPRKIKHPSHILKKGQELEVKVIDIRKDNKKLSLSLKQTKQNPWTQIKSQFSEGDIGEFKVMSVSEFGLFVSITNEIDGLIRSGDISWTQNVQIFDKYKAGDIVKAKVLNINVEAEKFTLGIKQLEKNPWALVEEKYPVGSRHEVEVSRVVDYGAFVRLKDNIEGLIHISELSVKRLESPKEVIKKGDKVTAEIVSIDKDAEKIALSARLVELDSKRAGPSQQQSPPAEESLFAETLKKSIKPKDSSNDKEDKEAAKPKEAQTQKKEETAKPKAQTQKKEDIAKPKEAQTQKKEDTEKPKAQTQKKKEAAKPKEAQTQKKEEAAKPKAHAQKKEDIAKPKEAQTQKKEETAKPKAQTQKKEETAKPKEAQTQKKEETAKPKEAQTQKKEETAKPKANPKKTKEKASSSKKDKTQEKQSKPKAGETPNPSSDSQQAQKAKAKATDKTKEKGKASTKK